jgi:hypothetical protein
VIARNPLGENQRVFARVNGNLQVRVIDVPRGVGQIDVQLDRLRAKQRQGTQK